MPVDVEWTLKHSSFLPRSPALARVPGFIDLLVMGAENGVAMKRNMTSCLSSPGSDQCVNDPGDTCP